MPRSIAILGASGSVGSTLAAQILRSDLLEPGDRLQLVGHGAAASEAKLLGTRIDLLDAFDEERVDIEMVPRIEDVDADIVVITSGVGPSKLHKDRRELAVLNRGIFEEIADKCAQRVPNALFLVVSNPVELGVRILATRIDRTRIFGMGAQQDSLRFARAIARDLHTSRRNVRATVLGEHGRAMVPLWSSVELLEDNEGHHAALNDLRRRAAERPLIERVDELQTKVVSLIESHRIPEAYETTRRALPDARIFVEPLITLRCMNSTPNATANTILMCLGAALTADRRVIFAQVLLDDEIPQIRGVCGVPITLAPYGWRALRPRGLTDAEAKMLINSVESIKNFSDSILESPVAVR
jgi:malate dehydrogenase